MSNCGFYGTSGYPGPILVEHVEQKTIETACLLEGTLVKTPLGYVPIEILRVGDFVVSHNKTQHKIIKTHKWACTIENKSDITTRIYKIPAGKQNTNRDLYLSFFHRVYSACDGWLRKPISLGYKEAADSEISNNGKYNIYHIRIENGEKNHLVVNGGCYVETWVNIPDI